jgi:hypothetical protein
MQLWGDLSAAIPQKLEGKTTLKTPDLLVEELA